MARGPKPSCYRPGRLGAMKLLGAPGFVVRGGFVAATRTVLGNGTSSIRAVALIRDMMKGESCAAAGIPYAFLDVFPGLSAQKCGSPRGTRSRGGTSGSAAT